jgi:hypothetical protein
MAKWRGDCNVYGQASTYKYLSIPTSAAETAMQLATSGDYLSKEA